MFKKSKLIAFLLLFLLAVSLVNVPVCEADSAAPPVILILVQNAPADLTMNIGSLSANRQNRGNESYFTFYAWDLKTIDYNVEITTGGKSFTIVLGILPQRDNNFYTLNLAQQTFIPGFSAVREVKLVIMRLLLTLLSEGAVFFLFGFRKKISWLYFLAINVVTQGILYAALSSTSPLNNYVVFSLIGGEFLVFIVEIAAFLSLVKEHRPGRTFLYVVTANIVSLALGIWLFSVLPI
jgi:hypothetical protein